MILLSQVCSFNHARAELTVVLDFPRRLDWRPVGSWTWRSWVLVGAQDDV